MYPIRRWLLIAGVLTLAAVAVFYSSRRSGRQELSSGAKIHLPAPDFTLPQLNGQPLQLSSYRGKVVLLDFWATWCVPCREEIPHFVELQQKYGAQGLQIIGVSMDDSADPVGPFYQQFHMNYPVVMGNAQTGELYGGVLGLPIAFLIDRNGHIQAKHIGATKAEVFDKDVTGLLKTD